MIQDKFMTWDEVLSVTKKNTGTEKAQCPKCTEQRSNKRDRSLYVKHDSGVAKCFYCDRLAFRESREIQTTRNYTLPAQEWKNHTTLSDGLVKWAFEKRQISQPTLNRFEISEEKVFFPGPAKEMNSIVFNYFEGETLVNKKYRSGNKDFTQSKGGKPIFYNINSVIGAEKVWIVEGEFDVLAMYEAGIKECISLPSGANDNDDFWINSETYLRDVQKFVIAVDSDDKGRAVREKIAQRLGRYRCTFIEWSGKDANDDLISGRITESLKNEIRFPVAGTFNCEDLYDDILNLYDNGFPATISPKQKCFEGLSDIFTVMRGHLITGTGIPSHGKSTFTDWYVLNLIAEYDMKASFFSPEHSPMELHMANFARKAVGKSFFQSKEYGRMDKEDLARFKDWSKERLYLTGGGAGDVVDWDWIFDRFKEQIFTFGIDIFVIDAFNKVLMPAGYQSKDGIDKVLTRLTSFAQQNNVIIFLIAHPTKMQKIKDSQIYEVPDLYNVSGSSDFRNQTHDGFCIYRYFENEDSPGHTMFVNLKVKYGFQGTIGATLNFQYNKETDRYYSEKSTQYVFDLTMAGPKEPIDYNPDIFIEPKIKPNEDFDFEAPVQECPF
jgi:twinkle protein